MLTTLQTAYTDTRAGDLAWCLGKDELPALAVLDRELPGTAAVAAAPAAPGVRVQLRLLGASHQVILDSPRGRCSETVACMPGSSAPLPFGVASSALESDDWAIFWDDSGADNDDNHDDYVAVARVRPTALTAPR
jgi:hypothetical protein